MRTGLTTHVIRAWQKRYNILNPARSEGGHRMYSEADVQRLSLIARCVRGGHRISSIASLSDSQLLMLMEKTSMSGAALSQKLSSSDKAGTFVDQILADLVQLNARALNKTLETAEVALGWQGLLQLVLAPTATEIGERWRAGIFTAAHEHFFTSTIKVYLGNLTRQYLTPKSAPRIVVTTPFGQIHELGATLVAAAAANIGWEVAYLGPNLCAADIAGAAITFGASVLALSIVYPEDDITLGRELMEIRRLVPNSVSILLGGRASRSYSTPISAIGGKICDNLTELCNELDAIRRKTPLPAPKQEPETAALESAL